MIFRHLIACALTLAAVGAAPKATATATTTTTPATRPSPPTLHASRILRVEVAGVRFPGVQFPTDEFFIALKERAQALGAARASLGGRSLDDWFTAGPNGDYISLEVKLPRTDPIPAPPVAGEIIDELVEFARKYVTEFQASEVAASLERAERRVVAARAAAKEADARLADIRQKLRNLSGRSDVGHKTLTAALSSADEEHQKLQLERLAKESRREALEEEIAKASERIEKRVEGDAIAAELKKVVEAREESVQTLKKLYASGQASQAELTEAVARAAEARAKMLQQQRDAAAAAGGAALQDFNRELMSLAIDSRELDAKTKYLEDRLARLRESVDLLDEFGRTDSDAVQARHALDEAERELREVRQRTRDLPPPRVMVKESQNLPLE